jgi:carbon-monoxide dehydrogenase small subunit
MRKIRVKFKVNGEGVSIYTYPSRTLLDVLREELNLTGTKRGCEIGECGACTVILNGKAVNSCLVLAPEVEGAEILTVEGLSKQGKLHPLQKSFIENDAVHCGFCTPGMLMIAKYFLERNPNPSIEDIKEAISGNLCRCTGYWPIIRAIERASKK